MSSTFSVPELLADVARLSNSPPFTASTNVTQSTVLYWLSQSARTLSALLQDQHGDDREFIQSQEITTSPGYNLVSLPDETDQVSAVLWRRGEQDLVLLESASLDNLVVELDSGQGWVESLCPAWRLEGETIAFYPASGQAETVIVYYTTHIGTGTGTFNARLDFDRWVTLDVCIKVATAKRRDTGQFTQDKLMVQADLLKRARTRDPNSTRTIRDVRSARMREVSRGPWWRL